MTNTHENGLATRLSGGRPLLGLYHGFPAEGILETIGPGWDFVWIDGQHGQFSIDTALRAVRTASALGLETVLRVPTHDAGLLAQYADTAASAMMIPQVESAEVAAAVVRALRFPPRGSRSFGGRRPIDAHGRDYYRTREPLVVVQIESQTALESVEQIAAVEGVDLLFFGADDMKLSLALPVETLVGDNDQLSQAQGHIARAARAAGKGCGCGIVKPQDVSILAEMGYHLLAIGGDVPFLRTGARQALDEGRRALPQSVASVDGQPRRAESQPPHFVTQARQKDTQRQATR